MTNLGQIHTKIWVKEPNFRMKFSFDLSLFWLALKACLPLRSLEVRRRRPWKFINLTNFGTFLLFFLYFTKNETRTSRCLSHLEVLWQRNSKVSPPIWRNFCLSVCAIYKSEDSFRKLNFLETKKYSFATTSWWNWNDGASKCDFYMKTILTKRPIWLLFEHSPCVHEYFII